MVVVRWLLAVGTPLVAGILISRAARRAPATHARELRDSEERTRLVLDTAPDAFITLDRDGRITTLERGGGAAVRLDDGGGDRAGRCAS